MDLPVSQNISLRLICSLVTSIILFWVNITNSAEITMVASPTTTMMNRQELIKQILSAPAFRKFSTD